jgi:uncharacterized membrane protein YbhN (UPF0104 family)
VTGTPAPAPRAVAQSQPPGARGGGLKRLLSLAVSLAILGVLYWKIDVRRLVEAFRVSDPLWMTVSLTMVVPLTLLTGRRLQQLAPAKARLGFAEANRLILAASVLNMVLPSKMGDFAKAYFMRDRGGLDGPLALSLVVFEKTCDMLSLLVWCVFGLLVFPLEGWLFDVLTVTVAGGLAAGLLLLASRRFARAFFRLGRAIAVGGWRGKLVRLEDAWNEMHIHFWGDPPRLARVAATSLVIWFFHLFQIWLFTRAVRAEVPFLANLALAPLAILAGLLPLTFAGVGTRDAAIVAFYRPFLDPPAAAAVGLLCTSRYLLPALGGLPFLGRYLRLVRTIPPRQATPVR